MRKRLHLKEQLFINKYIETGNLTEAADYAYDCKNRKGASVMGVTVIKRPEIQAAVAKAFRKEEMDEKWVLMGFKRHAEQKRDKTVSLRAYELVAKHLGMLKEVNVNRNYDTKLTTIGECKSAINESLDELNRLQAEYGGGESVLSGEGVSGVRDSAEGAALADMPVSGEVGKEEKAVIVAEGGVKDEFGDDRVVDTGDIAESEHKDTDSVGDVGAVGSHTSGDKESF